MSYQGSCLCGKVRFEIDGKIEDIVQCHCSQCRKAQGTAFATNGFVASEAFRFTHGEDQLSAYRHGNEQTRYFCRHCGSPMLSRNTKRPGYVRVRLGTIESDIEERPVAHIFVSSRANWDTISDDLPCYDGFEPQRKVK